MAASSLSVFIWCLHGTGNSRLAALWFAPTRAWSQAHMELTSYQQHQVDVPVAALHDGVGTFAGDEAAAQELVRNILDVMLRTPPPVTRDEWSEGGQLSWCGAAEVRRRVIACPPVVSACRPAACCCHAGVMRTEACACHGLGKRCEGRGGG